MGDRDQLHEAASRIVREKLVGKIKPRQPETPPQSTTCRGCGKPVHRVIQAIAPTLATTERID
jgi:hypothetical protein